MKSSTAHSRHSSTRSERGGARGGQGGRRAAQGDREGARRIKVISDDALNYLRERTFRQGFKAQFVAVDREGCALVAEHC